MFGIFGKLQDIAERLGTIKEAHMYTNGMVTIDVVGANENYHISLIVEKKEEAKND